MHDDVKDVYDISTYFDEDIVVKKLNGLVITPLFCPVCSFAMTGHEDLQFYKIYQACSECSLQWAEPNKELWKTGWRPEIDI